MIELPHALPRLGRDGHRLPKAQAAGIGKRLGNLCRQGMTHHRNLAVIICPGHSSQKPVP